MDVRVPDAVTAGLRRRSLDILTSQSDGTRTFDDVALLSRATELGRVLFTQDSDLLRIAQERQQTGIAFSGVVFAHQNGVSIGQLVDDLFLLATYCDAIELANKVTYLPLR
jgi:Domain of unknown function (DUF5615)